MGQDLIGYMLEALEAPEHDEISEDIENDPALREQLDNLRTDMRWIEESKYDFTPPAGLANRTMAFIDDHIAQPASLSTAPTSQEVAAGDRPSSAGSNRRMANWIVAASLLAASVLIAIPFLSSQQGNARLVNCQNNLREIGASLASYSQANGGFFPEIPQTGNRAVAGIAARTLVNSGYVQNPQTWICPTSSWADKASGWEMPTLVQLDQADGDVLAELQRKLGGSYGYHLGYLIDGKYQPARDLGRATHALITDSPKRDANGRVSVMSHGKGQNVLFEDMQVRFIVGCTAENCDDDIYLNRLGKLEPGVDINDAVIGNSETTPLRFIKLHK